MKNIKSDGSHLLARTEYKTFPTTFIFFDTETRLKNIGSRTKVHSLRYAYAAKYKRTKDNRLIFQEDTNIHKTYEFIEWLNGQTKDKQHIYLIAHNIPYDATILDLFRELPRIGFQLTSKYSKGQVSIFRWKRGTTKLTMLDNGNLFAGSLERWGTIFGLPKLEIDFETCTPSELEIYCRRDVEIMVRSWQTWIDFIHANDCVGFRETVGGTAFGTWRYHLKNSRVWVHKNDEVLKLERESYHGGRVEAFYKGLLWTDHYYYLDINNMYGFIMRNGSFPIGLQGHSRNVNIRTLIEKLRYYSVIARVGVNVDEPAFITKVNGHTAYPIGHFETVLTTDELRYGLSLGWIESVSEIAWYRNDSIFTNYIDRFYDLRIHYKEIGNKGFEMICKLLINSLYGKFGQTGIQQKIIGRCEPDEVWNEGTTHAQTFEHSRIIALGGSIFEEIQSGESYHAMPAIAAHVTANARLYLLSMIRKAGWNNVFYCDTDSLIVNQRGFNSLSFDISENELGKLKVETHSPYLIINAPKDYEMSERKKIKGIRSNAIEIAPGIFRQEQWVKLAGLIRQGFNSGYTSKEILKHQERVIYSGSVLEDGRIVPFEL